jgi:hypothetical protein
MANDLLINNEKGKIKETLAKPINYSTGQHTPSWLHHSVSVPESRSSSLQPERGL